MLSPLCVCVLCLLGVRLIEYCLLLPSNDLPNSAVPAAYHFLYCRGVAHSRYVLLVIDNEEEEEVHWSLFPLLC